MGTGWVLGMAMKEAAANRLKGLRQTSCGLIAEYRSVRFPSSKNCPEQRDKRKGHSRDSCCGALISKARPAVCDSCSQVQPYPGGTQTPPLVNRGYLPHHSIPPYPLLLLIVPSSRLPFLLFSVLSRSPFEARLRHCWVTVRGPSCLPTHHLLPPPPNLLLPLASSRRPSLRLVLWQLVIVTASGEAGVWVVSERGQHREHHPRHGTIKPFGSSTKAQSASGLRMRMLWLKP